MNQDYINSCRFCLNFVEIFDRIEITEKIREQFTNAVNINLSRNVLYPEFYCIKCSQELQICLSIKEKFAANQKILEESLCDNKEDLFNIVLIKTEVLDEVDFEPETDNKTNSRNQEQEIDFNLKSEDGLKTESNANKRTGKTKERKKVNPSDRNQAKKNKKFKQTINRVPCKDCGKSFRTDSYKKHYERIHMKVKKYQCDLCGRSFYARIQIEYHIMTHQGYKNEVCNVCGLKFSNKSTMQMHYRLKHTDSYIHNCHYCGKMYNTKNALEGHIRSKHTKERKYPCPVEGCGRAYFTVGEMIMHKKKYHKAYETCPICSTKVKGLKNHMKYHEKKFVCDKIFENDQTCNKAFANNYDLRKHIDTQHRGMRSFSCTDCNSEFSKKSVLENHIRTVHESKRIRCELCSTLITRKDYYRRHVLENHKELDNVTRDSLLEKIKNTKKEDLFTYQK